MRDLASHPLIQMLYLLVTYQGEEVGMVLRTGGCPPLLEYEITKYWNTVKLFPILKSYHLTASL